MESIGGRILKAMNNAGMNPNKLAISSGLHASTISSYISNKRKPNKSKLYLISSALNVNSEWLIYGIGEMETKKVVSNSETVLNTSSETLSKQIEILQLELKHANDKLEGAKEQIMLLNEQIIYLKENGSIFNKDLAKLIQETHHFVTRGAYIEEMKEIKKMAFDEDINEVTPIKKETNQNRF